MCNEALPDKKVIEMPKKKSESPFPTDTKPWGDNSKKKLKGN